MDEDDDEEPRLVLPLLLVLCCCVVAIVDDDDCGNNVSEAEVGASSFFVSSAAFGDDDGAGDIAAGPAETLAALRLVCIVVCFRTTTGLMALLPGPVAGDEVDVVVLLVPEEDGAPEVEAVAGDSVVVAVEGDGAGVAAPFPVEGVLTESAAGDEVVSAPRAALRRVRYAVRTISIFPRNPAIKKKLNVCGCQR